MTLRPTRSKDCSHEQASHTPNAQCFSPGDSRLHGRHQRSPPKGVAPQPGDRGSDATQCPAPGRGMPVPGSVVLPTSLLRQQRSRCPWHNGAFGNGDTSVLPQATQESSSESCSLTSEANGSPGDAATDDAVLPVRFSSVLGVEKCWLEPRTWGGHKMTQGAHSIPLQTKPHLSRKQVPKIECVTKCFLQVAPECREGDHCWRGKLFIHWFSV